MGDLFVAVILAKKKWVNTNVPSGPIPGSVLVRTKQDQMLLSWLLDH